MFKFALILFLVAHIAHCQDEQEGKCFSDATNEYYEPGDSHPMPNYCGVAVCNEDLTWTGKICGSVDRPEDDVDEECEFVPEDQSKPFPDCCQSYIC